MRDNSLHHGAKGLRRLSVLSREFETVILERSRHTSYDRLSGNWEDHIHAKMRRSAPNLWAKPNKNRDVNILFLLKFG